MTNVLDTMSKTVLKSIFFLFVSSLFLAWTTKEKPANYTLKNSPALSCNALSIASFSTCDLAFPIPDNNCPSSVNFSIPITTIGTRLDTDIRLRAISIIIDHPWEQDLTIALVAPDGNRIELASNIGGAAVDPPYGKYEMGDCSQTSNFVHPDYCFNTTTISDPSLNTFIGDFYPVESFNNLTGIDPNGTWQLEICDDAAAHTGTLEFVELQFEELICDAPSNFTLINNNTFSTTFAWNKPQGGTLSEIEILEVGMSQGSGQFIQTTASTYTFSTLETGVDYVAYIREECPSGGFSPWTCPLYFNLSCTTQSPSIQENFDLAIPCTDACSSTCFINSNWKNESEEGMNWLVQTASSHPQTGPESDVSGNGNYLAIKTNPNTCYNKAAILTSNCMEIQAPLSGCHFRFNYHMQGYGIGDLTVEIKVENQLNWTSIWTKSSNQGSTWRTANLDLNAYHGKTVQFRFIASSTNHPTGEIAIDELQFFGPSYLGFPNNTYFKDNDGDGFGDANDLLTSCSSMPPSNYVANNLDCDDNNAAIHPDQTEIYCNGIDENCNGLVDDALLPNPIVPSAFYSCEEQTTSLNTLSSPVGEYVWFEDLTSSTILASGQTIQSTPVFQNDTFYVEDRISIDAGLRITEIQFGSTSAAIELQNLGSMRDYSNWKVVLSDANRFAGNINDYNPIFWELGIFQANELQTRDALSWGQNFLWFAALEGWVLLIDENDVIQDAIFWNWTDSTIDTFSPTINGISYTKSNLPWNGNGATPCNGQNLLLSGNNETNSQADYNCAINDFNQANSNLDFSRICSSERVPVFINIYSSPTITPQTAIDDCGTGFGSIFLSIDGGQAPYNIAWNNGTFTQNLIDVPYDNYIPTVTDANGCTATLSFGVDLVGPSSVFEVSVIDFQSPTCYEAADGQMMVEVSGGTPPYQYNWRAGYERDLVSTTDELTILNGGIHDVTVTDANGCVVISNVIELVEPNPIIINTIDVNNISCFEENDGAISIEVNGGTAPYTYEWSNNSTTENLENLSEGFYQLTISDLNDCEFISAPIEISAPESTINIQLIDVQDVDCFSASNGHLFVQVNGGTPPYTYNWNLSPINSPSLFNLSGGAYQLTITDANACETISPIYEIQEATEQLSMQTTIVNAACNGAADGSISLQVDGGVAPYSFAWSNFEQVNPINNLPNGTYFCTVTDAVGCYIISPAYFVEGNNTDLAVNLINSADPVCFGDENGTLDISVNGGTPPYTYQWSTGDQDEDLMQVSGGIYTCTITDAEGCEIISPTYSLNMPDPLIIAAQSTVSATGNDANGVAEVFPSGGNPPYTYLWDDATQQTTPTASGLVMGTYQVIITDASGCTVEESLTVFGTTSTAQNNIENDILIYPNPASDQIWITTENSNRPAINFQIVNALGVTVYIETEWKATTSSKRIDVSPLTKGVYFVIFNYDNQKMVKKLILE